MNDDTATLENEAINAMAELVSEHGYSAEDLQNLVSAALGNA